MLGRRLRSERRNTCRYGCCIRTKAAFVRKTKDERGRDARTWRREYGC